jgi:O-methyltransferase
MLNSIMNARQIASRVANFRKQLQYRKIYHRFRNFTMIPKASYLANLQLAASVSDVHGCIVECGVWRGGMSAGMAAVLGSGRDYLLFDSFEGLPAAEEIDGQDALNWQSDKTSPTYFGNCTADESFARAAMALAGISNPCIIKGWFESTVGKAAIPAPIALLRLDGDWYKSTMTCLTQFAPLVAPGGVIVIDDYHTWDGCSRAVHDYLSDHDCSERICSHNGVCFIRKRVQGPRQ